MPNHNECISQLDRRQFLSHAALGALAGAAGAGVGARSATAAGRRPNFLVIVSDDHRWDMLGCAGHPVLKTPNLDRLAAEGARFANAFVTTPICCTSRASILTGLHARTHGVHDFATDLSPDCLALSYPARFKAAGWRTGFFGKHGVGANPPRELLGLAELPPGKEAFYREVNGERRHVTRIIGDQAAEFIRNCPKDQPFCASVSFTVPHAEDYARRPYPPEPEFESMYADAVIPVPKLADNRYYEALPDFLKDSEGRRRWGSRFCTPRFYQESMRDVCRMITGMDAAVGRLRAVLDEAGVADNTVILFMGDNGAFYGERGLSDKWYAYEESVRVPLMVYDPATPASFRGAVVEPMALNIDIAPTLFDRAGLGIPGETQGRSLLPWLRGGTAAWRSDWYFEHLFKHPLIPRSEGIRDEHWTYIRWIDQSPLVEELYDLRTDPQQVRNLAQDTDHMGQMDAMRARWAEWRRTLPEHA
jgi:arylsulfatase A-like enzyme